MSVTVKVLDPADDIDFLSLREAKALLGLPATGTPEADAQLRFQIASASATIARLCNRMFAKTRVQETWRGNTHQDIYLRLWPVEDDDVETINGAPFDPAVHELENQTGKIRVGGIGDPVRITYSGGYDLPDEAPDDLKHACLLLVRQSRTEAVRESVEGIRMIAHKESRVIFFDPNASTAKTAGGQQSGLPLGVDDLLSHYIRDWV
jgi:hypothetical protein